MSKQLLSVTWIRTRHYLRDSVFLQGTFCGPLCRKSTPTNNWVSSLFSIQSIKSMCDATNRWFPNKFNVRPLYYLLSPLFKEMASITRKRIFQTSFSEDTIFIEREIEKKANFIPSILITATGALDHIKRDSDSLVLVGEGRRKIYQQWMIVFKVDNDEIVEAVLQFLLLHLSLLIKWALSEAQPHNKFNVTLFIPALNKVFTWSDDKCKVLG